MKGKKTGGRTKGTPNRVTRQAAEILQELNCDPIKGMALIATNKKHAPELRGRMYAELAGYVHPKRKAIEVTGPSGKPLFDLGAIREYIQQAPADGE